MNKIKLAILEDSPTLLNGLIRDVEASGIAKVVCFAQNPENFIVEVRAKEVDALLLDIEMEGHSINGLDVARELRDKPLYFITGKAPEYVERISSMKLDQNRFVDFTSKNIDEKGLTIILSRLADAVHQGSGKVAELQLKGGDKRAIPFQDIVAIETIKGSKCKKLITKDNVAFETREYSFDDLLETMQFKKYGFMQVSKFWVVNIHLINKTAIDHQSYIIHYQLENLRKGIKVSDSFKARFDSAMKSI